MSRPAGPWRNILVVLLIVALFGLYAATRHGTPATRRVAQAVNQATLPVAGLLSSVSSAVRQEVLFVDGLASAESQVETLKAELDQARFTVMRERAAVSQDQTLRSLLKLRQSLSLPTVAADVIAVSPASWWESLGINRGSTDGVHTGDPVLASGGVVGRVLVVSAHVSTVMLLANGESGIGVVDARSGALGIALGNSVAQRLTVEFFSPTASVRTGDRLTTSSLGGVFTAGLPVATVGSVSVGPTGLISANAVPTVDPSTLTSVLVVEPGA